ncbi:MAG: secondary thiamine-phosphate synthase enzyme YjbQ [Spirochaetes bacterium]|nr:secondary thiamine-phosphate synthase enzyme YjbQ [Spirochaetota bacterium]
MEIFRIKTNKREEMISITSHIRNILGKNNIKNGIILLHIPHTTAAITINENADPDVKSDILNYLRKLIPENYNFQHIEGNSDAHIKASLIGNNLVVIVENGNLMLGRWQDIFFCEFDGPREREVWVKIING